MAENSKTDRTKRRRVLAEVEKYIENIDNDILFRQDPIDSQSEYADGRTFLEDGIPSDLEIEYSADESQAQVENDCNQHVHESIEVNSGLDSDFEEPLDSEGSEEMEDDTDFKTELIQWACKFNVPHNSLSELLRILGPHHLNLPKDPRTLLRTQTRVETKRVSGGIYYHVGIVEGVTSALMSGKTILGENNLITLQVNIDGLPLFKSSNTQFWPLLGLVNTLGKQQPFLIGIFHGNSKPSNLNFLTDFVTEYKTISAEGIDFLGTRYQVVITAVMCDAPARAMVKNVKGHSGYSGCDKCEQYGVYRNKVTFPETCAPRRTDHSFLQKLDARHHIGPTPLTELSIGMVSQFPLDYMHLVCLGVMRRLLKFWMKGPLNNRQGPRVIQSISSSLSSLHSVMPCEFARKPRPLTEFERWKATEFRQLLLYTGPVVLLGQLSEELLQHFMMFSVSMFIFLNPVYCTTYNEFAHDLLVSFVEQYAHIYGRDMITYNIHGLVHLSEEVKLFGALDNISCFPFESYLGQLKRLVRKPSSPLEQVIRRLSEKQNEVQDEARGTPIFQQKHHAGPVPVMLSTTTIQQFKVLNLPDCILKITEGNNCVQIGNSIALVHNFISSQGQNYIVYKQFRSIKSYFKYPLNSKLLGIFKVKKLRTDLEVSLITDIVRKYVLMPKRNYYVAIPLLHH